MPREPLTLEQLQGTDRFFYDAINSGNPLACVLIAVSTLEQSLGTLLSRFLIECPQTNEMLDEMRGNNPLGSFANRNKMAYCLGLITEGMYQNLKYVAQIRNRFAHSHVPLDFDSTEIKDLCGKLAMPKFANEDKAHPVFGNPTSRMRFVFNVLQLNVEIKTQCLIVERSKCRWNS